jgi:alpha-L-rhamnosidase
MTRVPRDQGECREIRPTPMFRKSFVVSKPVARARVYASGLGYHDLSVNGVRASDRVLDPQFTDYGKTVLYTTGDVTSLLRPGQNVIASELGSGKFDDAARTWDWGWHKAQWRATPRLRLDLYVTYTDGTEQVVRSDDSWRVSVDGPTRYDSYYLGETYDARRAIAGWKSPGFDDARWGAARVVGAAAGIVCAKWRAQPRGGRARARRAQAALSGCRRLRRRTEPQRRGHGPPARARGHGHRDLLQRGPGGRRPRQHQGQRARRRSAADRLLRRARRRRRAVGAALHVQGIPIRPAQWAGRHPFPEVSVAVEAVQQVSDDFRRTSTFESGHPLLDRIHEHADWAIQENNVSGITTDTPIYEKNAWTGDAQLTAGTFSTLYDTERLYRKQIQDMRDEQTAEGEVPHLAPSNVHYGYLGKPAFKPVACCGATPPWDAFWFVVPWEGYVRYGDAGLLESAYPGMQKYLDEWIPRWTDKDGDTLPYTLTSGLGDWCAPKGVDPVISLSATAYYAQLARITADAARALGKQADAARYDALFTRIRTDFNTKYRGADGIYREKPGAPFA